MPDTPAVEKDKQMKQLKRCMECWREVILPLNSILLWEQSWHPGLILGLTTSIFLLMWFMEPAILTVISVGLLLMALGDYLGPILISTFCSTNSWTGQKERKLDEICQRLSNAITQLQSIWKTALWARTNHANMYYGVITAVLLGLALIGNTVNNLFLMYVIVNSLLLLPGLRHNGRMQQPIKLLCSYLTRPKLS
ncbi:ADP-ribosylation factor-like protein 6-interacting protein 1 [Diprion similis]|uniref:ADP-ribosylation factor-like protein 6-interacting protein 1 n=1 Tax=Diprion similis TaxID=362088 RepID=UPI001EF85075|nr:ADP-ribosylation factor-like protein 6-interacting protein 1 [Diprion similis]